MAHNHALRGSCSCGRNQYIVEIPSSSDATAKVFFDNTAASRRHQAAPLTAWLRVPLSWYHSTTIAYFPDETHSSIRRTYSQPTGDQERRQFCGYCGTQLSAWNETTREHGEFISLTLGSLIDEDLDGLEDMGLLPSDGEDAVEFGADEDGPAVKEKTQDVAVVAREETERPRGVPWFESMVENSRLGRIRRQRGGETSRDGSTTVEWEVIEMEDGSVHSSSTKRKIGQVEEDVHMGPS